MKADVKARIRNVITAAVKLRQWLMDHGYGAGDMDRRNAITRINRLMDHYRDRDAAAHIWLVTAVEKDLRTILPGASSKNHLLREKILNMIAWCQGRLQVMPQP